MGFLSRLFARRQENATMMPLYNAIVSRGRDPFWYETANVPDSLDGRFDAILMIFAAVNIRLEGEESNAQALAWLTELFVTDMDGQLRQIGISDVVVGKHIGKMMEALGGRLGAYREGLLGQTDLAEALKRNLYRGEAVAPAALAAAEAALKAFHAALGSASAQDVIAGHLPDVQQ